MSNCNKLGEIVMKVAVAFIFLARKYSPKLSQLKLWRKHNSYIFQLAKGAVLEMRCKSCSVCRWRHFHRLSTHSAVFFCGGWRSTGIKYKYNRSFRSDGLTDVTLSIIWTFRDQVGSLPEILLAETHFFQNIVLVYEI